MTEWRDKETMKRLYCEEDKNIDEIASILECSNTTVSSWLKKHDIKVNGKRGRSRKYSNEEMLEWIESFVETFEFVPGSRHIRGWPGPALKTYEMRFGTFTEAVREAGYTPRGDKEKN